MRIMLQYPFLLQLFQSLIHCLTMASVKYYDYVCHFILQPSMHAWCHAPTGSVVQLHTEL